ncbi:MAG: hypothetical protein EBT90_09380 [Rhodobacteraceae bacterium]|nr:hypothetical protein [Paracoccaceae bacterium]
MTATISSHLLNGTDGTHASDVAVSIVRINADGRDMVFQTATDSGGRLMVELDLSQANPHARYELVIASGASFTEQLFCLVVQLNFTGPNHG